MEQKTLISIVLKSVKLPEGFELFETNGSSIFNAGEDHFLVYIIKPPQNSEDKWHRYGVNFIKTASVQQILDQYNRSIIAFQDALHNVPGSFEFEFENEIQ